MDADRASCALLRTWQQTVQRSSLPPLAKLVCLNLSLYQHDRRRQGCWPSLSQQMRDTGLARLALTECLKWACEAGYLARERTFGPRGMRCRTAYRLTLPGSVAPKAPGGVQPPPAWFAASPPAAAARNQHV